MDFHHQFIKHSMNRELDEIYLSMAIRSFAFSLINLFLPLYLYIELFSAGGKYASIVGGAETAIWRGITVNVFALKYVFLFYLILYIGQILFIYFAGKIVSKYGMKHSILFSAPITIIFYLSMYFLKLDYTPLMIGFILLFVMALLGGANNALFWIAFHTEFSKVSDKGKQGKEYGYMLVLNSLLSVFGPIIGGIIVIFFGFGSLLLFVAVLLMIFPLPLFSTNEIHESYKFDFKGIFKNRKAGQFLPFLAYGFETGAVLILWPVIIFLYLTDFSSLGLITSFALFISLLFTIYIGNYADKHSKKDIVGVASIVNSIVWLVKLLVVTPLQIFSISSFSNLTRTGIEVPFNALTYERANKESRLKYVVFRQHVVVLGRVLLCGTLFFVSNIFFGLVLASIVSLFYIFI